ncbi:hypothetical protein [Nocardia cerradoensis]|nr:hypothetical protein [Nocardia cerradoensis]
MSEAALGRSELGPSEQSAIRYRRPAAHAWAWCVDHTWFAERGLLAAA